MATATTAKARSEEHTRSAQRFRDLLLALSMNQAEFAEATSGLISREKVNSACNGHILGTTIQWVRGVATAAGIGFEAASDYIEGKIGVSEVLRLRELRKNLASDGRNPRIDEIGRSMSADPRDVDVVQAICAQQGGLLSDEEVGAEIDRQRRSREERERAAELRMLRKVRDISSARKPRRVTE
jgi:hypothetical protein